MRAVLVMLAAGAAACVLVVVLLVAPPAAPPPTSGAGSPGGCQPTVSVDTGDDAEVTLEGEQTDIVSAIIEIGASRDLPPRAWQIAIQAGMTESRLRNLAHGDRDSLGIFQMRPSMGWGTEEELQNIEYQINKFYDVLLEVENWHTMRPGDAAQAVERSAFPDRYHEWEVLAVSLIANHTDLDDPAGCDSLPTSGGETAQVVIAAAREHLGTPYAWGGGDAYGPTQGIRDGGVADAHGDYNTTGFDCSGLTVYAYAQAGISLPRVSHQQYDAGEHIPVEEAQPGDLVFWSATGEPEGIDHVAIYLGGGEILEAPQSGEVVQISELRQEGLVENATRPVPDPE